MNAESRQLISEAETKLLDLSMTVEQMGKDFYLKGDSVYGTVASELERATEYKATACILNFFVKEMDEIQILMGKAIAEDAPV